MLCLDTCPIAYSKDVPWAAQYDVPFMALPCIVENITENYYRQQPLIEIERCKEVQNKPAQNFVQYIKQMQEDTCIMLEHAAEDMKCLCSQHAENINQLMLLVTNPKQNQQAPPLPKHPNQRLQPC